MPLDKLKSLLKIISEIELNFEEGSFFQKLYENFTVVLLIFMRVLEEELNSRFPLIHFHEVLP